MAKLSVATADLFAPAKPTIDGDLVNETRYYVGLDREVIMWLWDGFDWIGHPISPSFASGNPNGSKLSACVNHLYVNTTDQKLYRATLANSNSSWVEIGAGGGGC
jgi:hypothetical protein